MVIDFGYHVLRDTEALGNKRDEAIAEAYVGEKGKANKADCCKK